MLSNLDFYFERNSLAPQIIILNHSFHFDSSPRKSCCLLCADDTLIILKADEHQILALKQTLHSFSTATGQHINFDKTTFLHCLSVLMKGIGACSLRGGEGELGKLKTLNYGSN